jgi:hypothetical protein
MFGPAAVVAAVVALALTTAGAGAQGTTSTCPVGGKGAVTLAVYAVEKCVGNAPSPISGFNAATDLQNAEQYCSAEPASGDATLGQALISQAAGYQQPVAGWKQASTAYFAAEGVVRETREAREQESEEECRQDRQGDQRRGPDDWLDGQ